MISEQMRKNLRKIGEMMLMGKPEAKPMTCEWKLEKYPDEGYELYRTECVNEYNPDGVYLDEDDNRFCRFCGGIIKEIE